MFVVLKPGSPNSYSLLEAFVQIRDIASCNETHSGAVTDRMICAGPSSGSAGPCFVRGLNTIKLVCEIFTLHSNKKFILIILVKAVSTTVPPFSAHIPEKSET